MGEFWKYERISFCFFLNSCTWVFYPGLFNSIPTAWLMILNVIITVIGVIIFTIKAIFYLNISKFEKVLLVVVQLIAYFIIFVIWVLFVLLYIKDRPIGPGL